MRRWVALTDALSVTAALLVAHVLRFGLLPDSGYLVWVGVIASVTVATFALLGLYRDRSVEPLPELGRVALATTLLPLGVLLVAFLTDVYLSRTWIALSWIIATGLVVLSRTAWRFAASPGQHDTTAGQTQRPQRSVSCSMPTAQPGPSDPPRSRSTVRRPTGSAVPSKLADLGGPLGIGPKQDGQQRVTPHRP